MVEKLINQYGMDILLRRSDGDMPVRGFFQPVTGKVERLALAHPGVLGQENARRYIYIGPLEPGPGEWDLLQVAGKEYRVRSVHQIQGTNGPVYTWGMCTEKGGEDAWGVNG